jgi:hypothetical protein
MKALAGTRTIDTGLTGHPEIASGTVCQWKSEKNERRDECVTVHKLSDKKD